MKNLLPILVCVFLHATTYSQTNYAIGLNGTNQWASIGSPIPNNSSYTKEAWINVTSIGGAQNIISSSGAPFWFNGGILSAGQGGSYSIVTDGVSFTANKWTYVAVTYDAATTTMKLYKDGIVVSTNAGVASNYANETVYLASHTGGNSLINGSMDEVRIWTIALTQAQIKQNMYKGPAIGTSGLVAYYKCNDGSGTTLTNATGGTNGSLQNSPPWLASPIVGTGNGITFDGSDDNIVIPHVVSSDFTVEYWMKTNSTGSGGVGTQWYGGNGIVDAEVGGGTYDWGTSLTGNRLAFGIGLPDITIQSTSIVNTGNWIHVAASWKQSTGEMKLYINGTQEATNSGSVSLRTAPTRITFGMLQTNGQFFNGSIDEVRIWNEVRTLAQIQANMSKELTASAEPTLLAYYTFNQGIANGTNTGLTVLADMKNTNNGTLNNFALSGSTSNFTTQSSAMFTLPLQWLSFTAQKQTNNVLLKWSTLQEQNTKEFIIQQSSNGSNWNSIATVAAAGNSSSIANYSYVHTNPPAGVNYYRILQTDLDEKKSYSDIRTINAATAISSFTIRNNPVTDGSLTVVLNKPVTLSLYNNEGRLLWQKNVNAGVETINTAQYAKGIYLLKAGGDSKTVLIQ